MAKAWLSLTLLCHLLWWSAGFLPPISLGTSTRSSADISSDRSGLVPPSASFVASAHAGDSRDPSISVVDQKNAAYIDTLLDNLTALLDKYILTGASKTRDSIYNVLQQIESHGRDASQIEVARRRIQRSGLPLPPSTEVESKKELGRTDDERRRQEAEQRNEWEAMRGAASAESSVASSVKNGERSALSRRSTLNGKPDLFMGQIDSGLSRQKEFAEDKVALQNQLDGEGSDDNNDVALQEEIDIAASEKVSEMVAQTGAAKGFEGQQLGIGGLDDVLAQVKRRVWTPLAAPPQLLQELGITPVRGLLLYGRPGCGKTLLARKLGQMLSPLRPITVVSGPEVMDKFVGSSEKALREIFDNPPDIYDFVREQERDNGDAIAKAALHVIIMDEFDAIARHRGGRGGSGDQGDAGVARDSVVNQLLAKMDGVAPLVVPTLVIGLTNKRSLIDAALLRPGRFEVQIEVPPPRTVEQRISILKVHTRDMYNAGRLLLRDAPEGSASANMATADLPSYDELLQTLAEETEDFSGASLAGMCRAAASHALERAVEEFTNQHKAGNSLLRNCVVTIDDFEDAKKDFENMDASDYEELSSDTEDFGEPNEEPPIEEEADVEL